MSKGAVEIVNSDANQISPDTKVQTWTPRCLAGYTEQPTQTKTLLCKVKTSAQWPLCCLFCLWWAPSLLFYSRLLTCLSETVWPDSRLCCCSKTRRWKQTGPTGKQRIISAEWHEVERRVRAENTRLITAAEADGRRLKEEWKVAEIHLKAENSRLRAEWEKEKQQWQKERQTLEDTITLLHEKTTDKALKDTGDISNTVHSILTRSDDLSPLEPVVTHLSQKMTEVSADVQALKNTVQEAGTSVYVRWGRSVCPSSTQLVYSGVVGGSNYNDPGQASNYLCLTMSPSQSGHTVPGDGVARLFGAEYQTGDSHSDNKDPVCSVCRSPRPTTVMIPGTDRCQAGWTTEYTGFLMAGWHGRDSATEFICVDSHFDSRAGSDENRNGKLLHFTATVCGSLPCGPYVNNTVVTCAVCSK